MNIDKGIKKVVAKQYGENVDRAMTQLAGLSMPAEGWIRTVRKALSMSGAQLGRRLGVTRGLVSNTEKAELNGGVTLKSMGQIAQAMDCRFVYAIVPENSVADIIRRRAFEKARERVEDVSVQMALEDQLLNPSRLEAQIEYLATEMIEKLNSDFWNDKSVI